MSALAQKFENGLCRCCLSEGLFKSLSDIDCSELQQEIFAVTLKNCFSISLSPMFGQYSETTYGICDMCIYKLREANSFKNLVQESETKFQQLYSNHIFKELDPTPQFKDEKVIEKPPMKRPKVEKNIEEIVMPSHVDMDDDDDVNDGDGDDHDNADDDDANDDSFDFNFDDSDDDDKTLFDLRKAKPTPKKAAKKKAVKLQDIEKKPEEKLKKGKKAKTSVEPKTKADKEKPADAEATERPKVVKRGKKPFLPEDFTILEDAESGAKKFSCHKCGAIVNSLNSIHMHILNIHHKLFLLECPLCPEKFQYEGKRATHLNKVHRMEELKHGKQVELRNALNSYNCSFCSKSFMNRISLGRHINYVHGQKKCTECNEMVFLKKFNSHMHEVHNKPMPMCGICGYKHEKQIRIIKHQRKVHMKEKNVQCMLCELKFFDTADLTKHMIRHKTERNYECNFCHKKFQRKTTLHQHIRIHTGVKNKVCTICSERFVQKASLNYHMSKHHPEYV